MKAVSDYDIREAAENLENFGYAANPFCEKCGGTGQVHPPGKDGHPVYSTTVLCPAPGCLAESFKKYKAGEKCMLTHGIKSWAHNFANFKKRAGTEAALKAFQGLAEGGTDKPFLFCYGGTGNGKTHLCEALTIRLMQCGIDTWYYTISGLMSLLKQHIADNTVEDLVDVFCKVAGLVLDDWGAEYGSDWERAQLDHIIDERYREKRLTVLVSNKSIAQLEESSQRIVSRFNDNEISVMVQNQATDYRPQKGG